MKREGRGGEERKGEERGGKGRGRGGEERTRKGVRERRGETVRDGCMS